MELQLIATERVAVRNLRAWEGDGRSADKKGKQDEALADFARAIEICAQEGLTLEAAEPALLAAQVFASRRQVRTAAQLLGLSVRLCGERSHLPFDRYNASGSLMRQLSGAMGFEAFKEAMAEGDALSLDDALLMIRESVGWPEEASPK